MQCKTQYFHCVSLTIFTFQKLGSFAYMYPAKVFMRILSFQTSNTLTHYVVYWTVIFRFKIFSFFALLIMLLLMQFKSNNLRKKYFFFKISSFREIPLFIMASLYALEAKFVCFMRTNVGTTEMYKN